MSVPATRSNEPIPGYKIRDRIGAGGYGEVWTAEVAGGLLKALKFVYGYLDEERAKRELKALNRIKSVRHPFLLSLERIEVVNGQLVIVTELADGSLKDRFDQCREEGKSGIPRDELLVYMRDTADALDHMSENFSLQHLDVKPENLLLLGGRIKVADFGLVKELHEVTGSMLGGLTPLYAPPEVFDGRPSPHSDQYSLAVLYQEMLTGILPFPGTTASQLAAQHMHSKPRLGPLAEADQQVIGRALSKKANDRFSNCREMVDHLVDSNPVPPTTTSSADLARRPKTIPEVSNERHTQCVDPSTLSQDLLARSAEDLGQGAHTEVIASVPEKPAPMRRPGRALAKKSNDVIDVCLPAADARSTTVAAPIDASHALTILRPTVYIGLGGTAGLAIGQLATKLRQGHAKEADELIRLLLVDTDCRAAMQTTQLNGGLDAQELVLMPLRKPQEYRESSEFILKSMSRRWIYNIPKSQQTEGMRPLGRLAFIDHAEKLRQQLRTELERATSDEAATKAAELTGSRIDSSRPRVVLVTSIGGGSGGGMLIDAAYLVRQVLEDLELADAEVSGVLMHATPRNAAQKGLAVSNAYSCLSELQHFTRSDAAFPGDVASGISKFDANVPPLDNINMVHLGDEIGSGQLKEGTTKVAELMYLDALSPCGALLNECQTPSIRSDAKSAWDVRARAMGIFHTGDSVETSLDSAANRLCERILDSWQGKSHESHVSPSRLTTVNTADPLRETTRDDEESVEAEAEKKANAIELTWNRLVSRSVETVQQQMGGNPQQVFSRLLQQSTDESGVTDVAQLSVQMDSLFGKTVSDDSDFTSLPNDVQNAFNYWIRTATGKVGDAISTWLIELMNKLSRRIGDAQLAAKWFINHCQELQVTAEQQLTHVKHDLRAVEEDMRSEHGTAAETHRRRPEKRRQGKSVTTETYSAYVRLKMVYFAMLNAQQFAVALQDHVTETSRQLDRLCSEIVNLGRFFEETTANIGATADLDSAEQVPTLRRMIEDGISQDYSKLAGWFAADFGMELMEPNSTLQLSLAEGESAYEVLLSAFHSSARRTITAAMKNMDVTDVLVPRRVSSNDAVEHLRQCLDSAKSPFAKCGGTRRLFTVVPADTDAQRIELLLQHKFDERPTLVNHAEGSAALISAIDNISLSQIALEVIDSRIEYAEVAARLYTRQDIDWDPWSGMKAQGERLSEQNC